MTSFWPGGIPGDSAQLGFPWEAPSVTHSQKQQQSQSERIRTTLSGEMAAIKVGILVLNNWL